MQSKAKHRYMALETPNGILNSLWGHCMGICGMWRTDTLGSRVRSSRGGVPGYPTIVTFGQCPNLAIDRAWYCIRGLLPISPSTSMHTFVELEFTISVRTSNFLSDSCGFWEVKWI